HASRSSPEAVGIRTVVRKTEASSPILVLPFFRLLSRNRNSIIGNPPRQGRLVQGWATCFSPVPTRTSGRPTLHDLSIFSGLRAPAVRLGFRSDAAAPSIPA